jgi:4-hydroxy-2-oxovalerate aldolase
MISPDTVFNFVRRLSDTGFEHIEIGHGLGLGAYRKYSSGFTDEELLNAFPELLKDKKLFCFFIPYIGEIDDLKRAREHGLYGVRIGTEPIYIQKYAGVIEKAKSMGFFVALNLMKSYAIEPEKLASYLKSVNEIVDIVYIVDSAGNMTPKVLKNYISALNESFGEIRLGFHGHNNLNLSVANALVAVENGVEFIDTTLGGIGRSGGNVPTETMLAVLNKENCSNNDNMFLETIEISKKFKEILSIKGRTFSVREEDIVFGYAGFHSAFETMVKEFTEKKGLDFNKFVIAVSKIEKNELTEDILSEIANKMNR